MMYYLADDIKRMVLCCETPEMANHLIKNGCYLIREAEFIARERVYRQWVCYRVALRKMLAELTRAA